jgi:hypothetical protein
LKSNLGNLLRWRGWNLSITLYIIVDQNFNISSHVGIPVNGIIGSSVFNNNLFEINYEKKKGSFIRTTRNRKG